MARKLTSTPLSSDASEGAVASQLATAILKYLGQTPGSDRRKSHKPEDAAKRCARVAAAKAALAAGTLALPPGPLGWLTILPEMISVWKIQAQMVSDIAALYGKRAVLSPQQVIWCLFKHSASQAVRDLVVRVGERTIIKPATLRVLQAVAQRIGVRLSQGALFKAASRWLPIIGPLGVGAYAYYDTGQVAASAIDLFSREIEVQPEGLED